MLTTRMETGRLVRFLPMWGLSRPFTDGLTWDIRDDPLLEDSNRNYLDPSTVETSPGEWFVVLSTADKDNALSGPHMYVRATLRR